MDEKEQSVEIGTDKSEETLLTQWQTCVEMANAVSQRRDAMNNLFVTLNLAIVAAASFIWDAKNHYVARVRHHCLRRLDFLHQKFQRTEQGKV